MVVFPIMLWFAAAHLDFWGHTCTWDNVTVTYKVVPRSTCVKANYQSSMQSTCTCAVCAQQTSLNWLENFLKSYLQCVCPIGLVINFIHHNWPKLLKHNFVEEFITPIVKVGWAGSVTEGINHALRYVLLVLVCPRVTAIVRFPCYSYSLIIVNAALYRTVLHWLTCFCYVHSKFVPCFVSRAQLLMLSFGILRPLLHR